MLFSHATGSFTNNPRILPNICENIPVFGFSSVIANGAGTDVEFSEMLDFLALDGATRSIILYVEGVQDAGAVGFCVSWKVRPTGKQNGMVSLFRSRRRPDG